MTSSPLTDLFQVFFDANEANAVVDSASNLLSAIGADKVLGIERYAVLKEKLKPELPFKGQRLFDHLDAAVKRRQDLRAQRVAEGIAPGTDTVPLEVVVSGAGPTGLRAAIELILLGQHVTMLEKRTEFSRVNILVTWQQTMDDLVALGAKYFYPQLKTHGATHMGTREMQLCLLKSFLLLGGRIFYGVEMTNIRSLTGFDAVKGTGAKKFAAICVGLPEEAKEKMKSNTANPLGFKMDKRGDYEETFRCNMMYTPEVEYDIFVPYNVTKVLNSEIPTKIDSKFILSTLHKHDMSYGLKDARDLDALDCYAFEFDALVLAEGEWSENSSKLGFEKVVDKFNEAIGLVINLEFDPTNKIEKSKKEFNVSKIHADWRNSSLFNLNEAGIKSENIEYMRGTTHYIVVTVDRVALAKRGVLKDIAAFPPLGGDNVDKIKLYHVAREIATIIGLPETAKFTEKNPVQIFDFSTRARAVHSHIWISSNSGMLSESNNDGASTIKVHQDIPPKDLGRGDILVPVFPVGDTLTEPFWPQGLGSNRGFHGSIDAAFAMMVLQEQGIKECSKERKYSYFSMNLTGWRNSQSVNKEKIWNADPINRYTPEVLVAARDQAKFEVPARCVHMDFKRRLAALEAGRPWP